MSACRECTIAAAIGFALDVCSQENIKVDNLEKIYNDGYESEDEVLQALKEFNSKVPDDRKLEANSIKCFAFKDQSECKVDLSNK